MRHSFEIEGPAFRLRPARIYDAGFIVTLRNDPERGRFLHRGATDATGQERWLRDYFDQPGDYYFVVENRVTGIREGTAGIYDLDAVNSQAEWGRWVLRRGSLAAIESAWLVYRMGFEVLGLNAMYCRTVSENASAVAFHDSFGVERARSLPAYLERDGESYDAIEGRLTLTRWLEVRDGIARKVERAAGWSNRGYVQRAASA